MYTYIVYIQFYLFFRYCTSFVAQDITGLIWHGRNFDYHFFGDVLKKSVINLKFTLNNKVSLIVMTMICTFYKQR